MGGPGSPTGRRRAHVLEIDGVVFFLVVVWASSGFSRAFLTIESRVAIMPTQDSIVLWDLVVGVVGRGDSTAPGGRRSNLDGPKQWFTRGAMTANVLYLGDTSLGGAAGYLAGVMTRAGIAYDYHASDETFCEAWLSTECQAVILSDYPSANFTGTQAQRVIERVQDGMGLLMIGGWESFTGQGGDYGQTPFRDVLPVAMQEADDRMNQSGPCVVVRDIDHPIVADLPFDEDAPVVGGFNRLTGKAHAVTVLSVHTFGARAGGDGVRFDPAAVFPLLVLGRFGRGQVAAFASDVAPHWVGGLVDWGKDRVAAQAPGAGPVEVGGHYARLFANLVRWVSVGPGGQG